MIHLVQPKWKFEAGEMDGRGKGQENKRVQILYGLLRILEQMIIQLYI